MYAQRDRDQVVLQPKIILSRILAMLFWVNKNNFILVNPGGILYLLYIPDMMKKLEHFTNAECSAPHLNSSLFGVRDIWCLNANNKIATKCDGSQ